MVYNTVRHVQLPHHNVGKLNTLSAYHKNMNVIKGTGMGSVLLRPGGSGSASTYSDIDDYIHTTGIDPFSRVSTGKGLPSRFTSKLSKLAIAPPIENPRKNIVMHM
jgi:hypothetical protein